MRYRFSRFLFDEDAWQLLQEGVPVPIQDKPLALLALLLQRPGHLWRREEVLEALWPDTSVTDQSLRQTVMKLRSTLADDGGTLVQTIRGRGFRFSAQVEVDGAPAPPGGARALRVLLVDDHTLFRQGLRSLLETEADIAEVHEASTAADAVALYEAHRPHVVLLDVELPGSTGMDAAAHILERAPEAVVLFLSGHVDRRTRERALATGARGYLSKAMEPEELVRQIRAAASG